MLVKATKVFSSCILVRNVFSEEITTRNLEDRRLSQAAIGFYYSREHHIPRICNVTSHSTRKHSIVGLQKR